MNAVKPKRLFNEKISFPYYLQQHGSYKDKVNNYPFFSYNIKSLGLISHDIYRLLIKTLDSPLLTNLSLLTMQRSQDQYNRATKKSIAYLITRIPNNF